MIRRTLLILLAFAASAVAQQGTMSMGLYNDGSSFRPDLTSADLKLIERVLGLGEPERLALDELYSGYAATLRNEGDAVRDFVSNEIERAQIMQDVGLLNKARAKVADWDKRSEQIKKTFLDDLKSLLTREEEARWPIVERELRRLKHIGGGRLSGESVDLVKMTEEVLGSPPAGELAELLNRYSEELDHAILARDSFLEAKRKDFSDAIQNDPARAKEIWEESQKVRGALRDINDRYARLIGERLPQDKRAEFQRRFFDRSYPSLVGPTRAQEYLKDAADLSTLTADQKSQIASIKTKYDSDRRALLVKAAQGWRQFEAEEKPESLLLAIGEKARDQRQYTGAWLPDTHPLIKYRQERLILDRALRESLDAMLKPDQRSAIPTRDTPYAKFENWSPWGL